MRILISLVLALLLYLPAFAQERITPAQAAAYIGKRAMVCGRVASARYSSKSKGQPTFLNLNKPFPGHVFTVVIWGAARSNFKTPPETLYRDKRICVAGEIRSFKGLPQIEATAPGQISEERSGGRN